MAQSLPPMAAIRVFEAAARHGNFTRAADELGMTQAAVSYQIKLLESRVGVPLFLRLPRRVELTEAGRRLSPLVTEAFETLKSAFSSIKEDAQGTLTISTIPTFATQWLAPRFGSFHLAHPNLAVRMEATMTLIDFTRQDIDVGIRSGFGDWPGLRSHLLIEAKFTPMLSPTLAETVGGIHTASDLLKLPIIDPGDPWWRQWFEAAGITDPELDDRPRSRLGGQSLEAVAAMAGNGVAIVTPAFYGAEVAAGRLYQPFDLVLDEGRGYYLVYPETRKNNPKIRAFRNWLLDELEKT